MLRFRLGPIPVRVHPSHFAVSALMGLSASVRTASGLARDVLIWMGVVFVSVLVHELGHAGAALSFGFRPDIELIWLGGITRPNAPGPIPWGKNVLLTLAGPFAGFTLAIASGFARAWTPTGGLPHQVVETLFAANLFWAAVNLAPVPPLDGGQVTLTVFNRVFGARGQQFALGLGALTGLGLALVFGRFGLFTLAALFALLGVRAAVGISQVTQQVPQERALADAWELLKGGQLGQARTLAEQVDAQEGSPLQHSAAQRLLGWIAIKEGEGRRALDHFSQVQRLPVEPQALAAAFSLVGDDTRALPLWEQSYREAPDATLLHEWAGSLIRLGRTEEALRLPGVTPEAAFHCAERVAFGRGDFSTAAAVGEEALRRCPSSNGAYDAACAYARAGRPDDALRLLQRAVELGFRDADFASQDPDLAAVHPHPGWSPLLSQLRESAPR
jgi:Zn-dependent protease